MSNTRFLFLTLASLIAALALIAVLPRLGVAGPSAEIAWTASLYADKERIAAQIAGPRILVVGGSATLFSFDSKTASTRLGRPVVNFGTHAGLGLTYILERASRTIRAGDIVLLAPEYDLLQQNDRMTQHTIQFVAFYDPGYIRTVPAWEWPNYLLGYGVLPSLAEAFKQAVKGRPPGRPDLTLDNLGNARGNTVARSAVSRLASAAPTLPPLAVSENARKALRDFAAIAKSRHAKVFVIPLPLIRTSAFAAPAYRGFLASLASSYESLGLQMLGAPDLTLLPPQDMYDSIYHANDRGRARYTKVVLDLACRQGICAAAGSSD